MRKILLTAVFAFIVTCVFAEVTFPENSHTHSRVTCRAPYNAPGYKSGAGYIYGTGRNWKGSVELEMASDKKEEDEAKDINDPENTGEKQPGKFNFLDLMRTNLFIRYLVFIVLHILIASTTVICVFMIKRNRKKHNNSGVK